MTKTAKIYGDSLYDLAAEEKLTEEILPQMEQIMALFKENPDYLTLLSEPSIPKTERVGLLDKAFEGQLSLYLLNYLKLLCESGMLREYRDSCRQFKARYNEDHNIAEAVVTTAVALTEAQAQALNSDEILYFSNHNKMLSLYEGANGIKTGFTKSTGRCLVSSAQRDGMEFIAVTLNDPNDWNDHAEMLDYAFSEHYPKKLIEQGDTVKVTNIDGKDYSMVAASDFTIPFKEHQKTQVEVISHISNDLQAPINRGEKVGCLEIVCDGVSVGEVDIISENDIYGVSNIRLKNSFFSSFIRVAKILLV